MKTKINISLSDTQNPTDLITVDIPLFIRLLEFAHEDAGADLPLHKLAENAVSLMQRHQQQASAPAILTISDYQSLVAGTK